MRWVITTDKRSFALKSDSGIVITRTQKPCLIYDTRTGELIRTGEYDRCLKYLNSMKADLRQTEDFEKVRSLVIFDASRLEIKDLNACVDTPDGVKDSCAALHKRLTTN